jgi:CIC family chloride channel protein
VVNKLQRRFLVIAAKFNFRSAGVYMMYGVVVGVVAGLGAAAFYVMCQAGLHYFLDIGAGYRPDHPFGEPPLFTLTETPFRRYMLILIPTLGGLIAGYLVYRFAPEAEGHGTDAAIDAYHNKKGRIRGRVPIIKALASAATLGSGGSGGREGPIAQIGAGFGSYLADRLGLDAKSRRVLLAAGLGAGIGSIFRAPLAGALFGAEILYREPEFEYEVVIPAIVTTIVAYSTFGFFFGFQPLFKQSSFAFRDPMELLPYAALAIVVAFASPLYIKVFYGVNHLFRRLPISNYFKPAIGGLLTGCVGFFLPQTLAFGYGVVQEALDGNIGITLLVAIALGKIVTTAFTIGSGGSGGVFGPSMVIGGCLGGAVGKLFQLWIPGIVTHSGAYVIVGMAGFFAAASNAPVSTVIMVSEMTGNYHLLMPAMWVCAIASIIGRRWGIYEKQVNTRFDSPAHYGDFVKDHLEDIYVRDIFNPGAKFHYIPETMTLREFIPIMTETEQQNFPVVNNNGELTGIFSIADVRDILVERDLDNLLIVKEFADETVTAVEMDENLASALRKFAEIEVDKLPVVESGASHKIIGMIRRRDVIGAYYEKISSLRNLDK